MWLPSESQTIIVQTTAAEFQCPSGDSVSKLISELTNKQGDFTERRVASLQTQYRQCGKGA
jgi:hypothetical protein